MSDGVGDWAERAPTREQLIAAGVRPERIFAWLERFHELREECGCVLGARCLLAGFVLFPVVWAVLLRSSLSLWGGLALWAGVAMLAMGIGKAVGVGLARRRLHHMLAPIDLRDAGRASTAANS